MKASLLSLLAPACPLQVGAAASPKEQGQESEAPPTPSASLLCAGVVWLWICHASTCYCRVCRQRRWWTQADPYAPTQQGRQGDSLQGKAWGHFQLKPEPQEFGDPCGHSARGCPRPRLKPTEVVAQKPLTILGPSLCVPPARRPRNVGS